MKTKESYLSSGSFSNTRKNLSGRQAKKRTNAELPNWHRKGLSMNTNRSCPTEEALNITPTKSHSRTKLNLTRCLRFQEFSWSLL